MRGSIPKPDRLNRHLNGRFFFHVMSALAVLDLSLRPQPGDIVLIRYDGITDFGRLMGQSFITSDGEAIEGEGVEVFGVVTFTVNDLRRDDSPVI